MPDEVTTTESVKKMSDGSVKIALEKYNELLEKAAEKPAVINQTTVIKTAEMLAKENRIWGGTLMGLGGAMLVVGVFLYKAGRSGSS